MALSRRPRTPDSHDFPTRPYDLVKEFMSPSWSRLLSRRARRHVLLPRRAGDHDEVMGRGRPNDVLATATGELAGTTTSATYGPPYNSASRRAEARPAVRCRSGPACRSRSTRRKTSSSTRCPPRRATPASPPPSPSGSGAAADQRTAWASAYADALAKAPDGDPAQVAAGTYGPVPVLSNGLLTLARSGGLEGG